MIAIIPYHDSNAWSSKVQYRLPRSECRMASMRFVMRQTGAASSNPTAPESCGIPRRGQQENGERLFQGAMLHGDASQFVTQSFEPRQLRRSVRPGP
ncbi:MAG: hypothetical protein KBE25_04020 [Laribacter sp.]|nr:hypothetical protein [Laribacter sp.]MBP9526788.1 hypothetical protein [Laribacter sp.]MBP9608501.1 hypothetical protein [Laribacter sp.]